MCGVNRVRRVYGVYRVCRVYGVCRISWLEFHNSNHYLALASISDEAKALF